MGISEKFSYSIAFFATLVRYYDYALFGLSASAISSNFMPGGNKVDQLLNFFMIFSIAVAARPIGSIIFGHISDKIGRAASVKITTIIAAISALSVALLPNYGTIGFAATIFLTIFRMLFIMSLAGEIDAIKIYISEKTGKKNRCFAAGTVAFSAQVGVLIAASMYHFTLSFEDISWLWRMNFIIGGCFGLVVFYLRHHLSESSYYIENKRKNSNLFASSLIKIISQNRLKFFLAIILSGVIGASYNFLVIFLSTFVGNVIGATSQIEAARNNIILVAIYAISCLVSGILSDKLSLSYKQIIGGLICSLIVIMNMQYLSFYGIFSFPLHMLVVFLVPIYMIPTQIKLQSIFQMEIRVRMCSLSHSIGSMVFSSTIPVFCMFLWKQTGNFLSIYMYFIILLLLMISAILIVRRKSYQNMFEN